METAGRPKSAVSRSEDSTYLIVIRSNLLIVVCLTMEGSGLEFVANHFDVVPVRANDERCIIVRLVLRA